MIFMSKALPSEVRRECIQVLSRCSEFEKFDNLKSVFDVQGLCAYKSGLPEADDAKSRVRQTLTYLQEKSSDDSSLLILFLEELISLNPGDSLLCEDLDKCIGYIEGRQSRVDSNRNKENIISIPFGIAAMNQEEAKELIS